MSDFGTPRDAKSHFYFHCAKRLFEIYAAEGFDNSKKKQRKEACLKVQHCLQILFELDGVECHEITTGGIVLYDKDPIPQEEK